MKFASLVSAALVCSGIAQAGLITSDPGGTTTTVLTVTGGNTFVSPPQVVNGFTVTASNILSFGNSGYGLGSNGSWSGFSFIATDQNDTNYFQVDLGGLFGLAGGFMNYGPGFGSPATIAAIAADGTTILESYDLEALAPISTPSGFNQGDFRGISRGTADIRFLRFSGDYILTHSITVGAADSAVPEPGTFLLGGLALTGLGLIRRYKRA